MLSVPLSCFYAILSCSIWQVAKAAPTIALHSLPASGGETFGVAGHQPCLNALTDFKADHNLEYHVDRSKSLYQVPLDETVPFAKDTQYHQVKIFSWIIIKLLKHPSEAPVQSLGLETAYQWKPLVRQYQELTDGKIGSLEAWIEKNHVLQGLNSGQEVLDLEWLIHRAGSQKSIWWESDQLVHWRKSKYDWKSMIKVGDQLQFDHPAHDFKLSPTKIHGLQKDLIPILESGKWTPPFLGFAFSGANGAEASREFHALRTLGGEDSLYDKRIGQVVKKIFGKMDQYQGDQGQLPPHLTSDFYLLALLRGKVIKPISDAQLQYVVDMPRHTVIVHRSLDGQDLRASLHLQSRGRLLPETYELGQAKAGQTNRPVVELRSTSPSPSQLDNLVSVPPSGSPSELNRTRSVSQTESPSTLVSEEKRGIGSGGFKCCKGGGGGGISAASRAETPWAVPARILRKIAEIFTNDSGLRKGTTLSP